MNSTQLFALLTSESWLAPHALEEDGHAPAELGDAAFEYLLKFCELNRNRLVDRIDAERSGERTPTLIYRITRLLLARWEASKDFRFINTLFKFRAKKYFDKLPGDPASARLMARLNDTFSRVLKHD